MRRRRRQKALRCRADLRPPKTEPGQKGIGDCVALAANELILATLVAADVGKVVAQAIAIVVVTPINFVGNKLWSFRRR